jgi:hypothetical protein
MPAPEVDQQLEWDKLQGFCQSWAAPAQIIRPDHDYTARQVGVLLARFLEDRRGPGVIKLEKVTDHKLPGELLAKCDWRSEELGPAGAPKLILRPLPGIPLTTGQEYRIVVHTLPGWEKGDKEGRVWIPDEANASAMWAYKSKVDLYPRGSSQCCYNYAANTGAFGDSPTQVMTFLLSTEELRLYSLSIIISPHGAGRVEVSPQKGAYKPREQVSLTAQPAEGSRFVSWGGDIAGTQPTATVVMDSAKTVMANFQSSAVPDIPIVGDIIAWIEAQLKVLWDWLSAQFTGMLEGLKDVIDGVLTTFLAPITTAIDWIKDKLLDAWYWITETLPGVLEWLKVKVLDMWDWVTTEIPAALSWVKTKVLDIWDWVTTEIPAALDWIKQQIISLWDTLRDIAAAVANIALGIIRDITGWLEGKLDELFGWVEVPGTTVWDRVKTWLRTMWANLKVSMQIGYSFTRNTFYEPDAAGQLQPKHWDQTQLDFVDGPGPKVEPMPAYIKEQLIDPVLDFFKKIWDILWDKIAATWQTVTGAIKRFFTEIVPSWFRTLWDALHTAVSWIWDKVSSVGSFFWDEILKLVHIHSPITPEGGLGTLQGVIKVSLAMVGGLGLMTLAGNLVHPIHSLGLEHISAMIYDLTNYRLLTGAAMGVIAATSLRIPLTHYFNALLRPNIPSERDVAEMYNRELIGDDLYSQYLGYRGYPDMWHKHLARLTETPIRYFTLAAIAKAGFFDATFFEAELVRGGYAPDSRKRLMSMFQVTYSETIKGLMSGTALKRFKEGMTTESQFRDELMLLGYTDQQYPQYLAAAKMDYAYDYITDLISAYRDAVRKGNISLEEYRQALLGLGIVPEKVEAYVLRERARQKPTEKLTPISPVKPTYETDMGKVQVDTLRRQRRKMAITRDQEISNLQTLGMPVDYARALADNDDIRLAEKAIEA